MPITVTADIVGSRRLADRGGAQRILDDAVARADADMPVAVRSLRPTVGDEEQGVFPSLESALAWLLLLQLALPDGVECRFGVGIGEITDLPSAGGSIPEGPGWWAAREAIDAVHALERRLAPTARTRVAAAQETDAATRAQVRLANAYLLARDQIVSAMSERTRRLTYGRLVGRSQKELAAAEGITQSAVSQALASAGSAAIIEGLRALRADG